MSSVVAILLAAVAWFGHAFLMTVILNVTYSQPVRRPILKIARAFVGLLVFLFPVMLFWTFGRQLFGAWQNPQVLWDRPLILGYLIICWLTALVYLPLISIYRQMRGLPSGFKLMSHRVEDIAKRIGEKPVGNGKHWRTSALPGNQCFEVEFREMSVQLPRLPERLDGLTILHLTDLHFCGTPARSYFQNVFDICLAAGKPDLLAITGDFVDSGTHHNWIVPLLGRLRWNVAAFAILGNHDWYQDPVAVRRRINRAGVRVVSNSWAPVRVRGESLIIIGNETPWFHPGPDLTKCPRELVRICLSHTPDNIRWAVRNNIDLVLAGHVHGGQIRVPFLGPIFVPSKYSRRYDSGAFSDGPTRLWVSRGLSGREPLRYNCRPEVTRLVLKK